MTTTNELQALAYAWAEKLRTKLPLALRINVYVNPYDGDSRPYYGAIIGEHGELCWVGYGYTPENAMQEAERRWRLDGAPQDMKDAERAKLRAKAAELGMTVT